MMVNDQFTSQQQQQRRFNQILNNQVVRRLIFGHVKQIHRVQYSDSRTHQWNDLIQSVDMLSLFGYLEPLKQLCLSIEQRYNRHKWSEIDGAPFIPKLRSLTRHAVIGGHLHILEWVHQRYFPHLNEAFYELANVAIQYDRVDIIQFFGHHPEFRAFNLFPGIFSRIPSESMLQALLKAFGIELPFNPDQILDVMINHVNLNAKICLVQISCLSIWSSWSLDLIKYLHLNGLPFHDKTLDEAARHGRLDVIQYILEEARPSDLVVSTGVMDRASMSGHLDIVRYLHEHRTEGCSFWAMEEAATKGHLDVLRFFQENRTETCQTNAMDIAAEAGHQSIVEYLISNRTEGCTGFALDGAALNGHAQIIEILCEKYPHLTIKIFTMMEPISRQVLEVLYRTMPQMIVVDDTLYNAIIKKHMDMINFIFDHELLAQCYIDVKLIGRSMDLPQSNIFHKFIKHVGDDGDNINPILQYCIRMAPWCPHTDILEYIHSASIRHSISFAYRSVKKMETVVLDSLAFIHEKGGLTNASIQYDILIEAIEADRLDIVKYMLDNVGFNIQTKSDFFATAIEKGRLDILQCMLSNTGGILPTSKFAYQQSVHLAICGGDLEMVRYLTEHYRDQLQFDAQTSFNKYLATMPDKKDSPKTHRFVEYMVRNHSVTAPPESAFAAKGSSYDLDATIALFEAGATKYREDLATNLVATANYDITRYLYFNNRVDRRLLMEMMVSIYNPLLFINLPMSDIILGHQVEPFIDRNSVKLQSIARYQISYNLLNKYII
ncbi:hypothetical protein SAMD00019534_036130 [Acytostelium subglobosum LB1]|uniref:hypothetical protein n=1 Tax=Acytostelium subglobosum LB1 TaxID=1410327 RepID=UPI000644B314|nr:hypothetical protein SAMD00019534_036130 [Acytostelium subglobosum LB1]GAM20438.1 hypothetical protein SAMD00019534_036130 [Acytostelium subglobosum LB1]|eukprot:XP_012759959.1 hypothetical protein SAMD00019534_036130 [Acytostelium subglobosum LB1]